MATRAAMSTRPLQGRYDDAVGGLATLSPTWLSVSVTHKQTRTLLSGSSTAACLPFTQEIQY